MAGLPFSEFLEQADRLKSLASALQRCGNAIDRQKPYDDGHFDLFLAGDKDTAEALIFSIGPNDQGNYICRVNELGQTALHFHSLAPRPDVVSYLLSLPVPGKDVLLAAADQLGQTALHLASSSEVAQVLVAHVEEGNLVDFILRKTLNGQTAVHTAAHNSKHDVIAYLMSIIPDHGDPRLLQSAGWTPLHCAKDADTLRCFMQSVQPCQQNDFAYATMGPAGSTILHRASIEGKLDIVESLLDFSYVSDSLLCKADRLGDTALHVVQNVVVANALINAARQQKSVFIDFLFQKNMSGQSAFRDHAFNGRKDILALMLNELNCTDIQRLYNDKDNFGKTALHWAKNKECAELLIKAVGDSYMSYILIEDKDRNTALLAATEQGKVDVFEYLFNLIRQDIDTDALMEKENKRGENVFHLAYRSDESRAFHSTLEQLEVCCDEQVLTKPDKKGNSPLLYIASRFLPQAFAQIIMLYPLAARKEILTRKNRSSGASCRTLIDARRFDPQLYLSQVIGKDDKLGKAHPRYHYQEYILGITGRVRDPPIIDPDDCNATWMVMYYALNEFSARAAMIVNGLHDPSPSRLDLLRTDRDEWHGKPKVYLCSIIAGDEKQVGEKVNLVPPGPDYMMVTVRLSGPSDSLREVDTSEDISGIVSRLTTSETVQSVTINSTFGRTYRVNEGSMASTSLPFEDLIIPGRKRGKALVICNRSERQGWKRELDDAYVILHDRFGLEVTVEFDLSQDMVERVQQFARAPGHDGFLALAIMSHGFMQGDIAGDDHRGECSVQDLIDALCHPSTADIPKLVLLSFCRGLVGGVAGVNRTPDSWECTDFAKMEPALDFHPQKLAASRDDVQSAWERNKFPAVTLPENCFVCYSTLPDSKSVRGLMFREMKHHINEVCKVKSSSTTGGRMEKSLPKVELLELLTDVSGIVRQKSRFTQYMNICYVLNRKSRNVWIELLHP